MVGDGIEQDLRRYPGAALVARADRSDRGHRAAHAVAAHGQTHGIAADLGRVLGGPLRRRETIVGRGGKFVLRRQPVVHRHDHRAAAPADLAAHGVVGVDAANDEGAAVEEHQDRAAGLKVRSIDADANVAPGAREEAILDGGDFVPGNADVVARQIGGADLLDRNGLHRRQSRCFVEHGLNLRM